MRAKGCEIWDMDGNHYYDMTTNGIGACMLGYADPDVTKAVVERVQNGSMTSLNAPEEVYLAEKLCRIHPWAESVRFARSGGEICAVAVLLRTTDLSSSQIAAQIGYNAETAFYQAFRKLFSMTPQKYKKLQKNKQ